MITLTYYQADRAAQFFRSQARKHQRGTEYHERYLDLAFMLDNVADFLNDPGSPQSVNYEEDSYAFFHLQSFLDKEGE